MSVESVLIDLQVKPDGTEQSALRDMTILSESLDTYFQQKCKDESQIVSKSTYTKILSGPSDSAITIKHYYINGLITISIEYLKCESLFPTYDEVQTLTNNLSTNIGAVSGACCPAVKRCIPQSCGTSPVMWTSDDRILEFKFEKLLYSARSPYQLVEIFETIDFGAALFLDGFINLSESDLSYTRGLMCHNVINYKDSQVLILGGGDGALLNELLKEDDSPGFVTMVDIDETVIKGCKEHMRSVCGDVFDQMETDKHKIIIDDAFKWLETFKKEEKKFNFIFGDLTDVPVHAGELETWSFIRNIVKSALELLPVGGKYITHCNGKCSQGSLTMFEKLVSDLGIPVEITSTEAVVPSFHERWVFYQLTKLDAAISTSVE